MREFCGQYCITHFFFCPSWLSTVLHPLSYFHPFLIYQFFYLSRSCPVLISFSSCEPVDKLTQHRGELTQLWPDLLYDCFFSFAHEYYSFNQHLQKRNNNKRQSNVKAGFQLGRKNNTRAQYFMVDYKISSPLRFKPLHFFLKHVINCPLSEREHKTFSVLILLIKVYK